MINIINSILSPLEKIVKKYLQYIRYAFIIFSIGSVAFLLLENGVKESGEKAILVLWIILWMPIMARVLSIRLFQALMPLRKELGILMGTLALVHGIGAYLADTSAIFHSYFWWQNGMISFYVFGFVALLLTLPLYFTSSDWAIKKLGKNWKKVHSLIYIIVILVVIHVVLLKWAIHLEYGPIIILLAYFIGKTLEWKGVSFGAKNLTYKKGQKWICIPCGYIYDPIIGDPDSGILPGTEFTDIPKDWRCPQCGVTKSDFTLYEEGTPEQKTHQAKVISSELLNPTTLELIIETTELLISKVGQFMSFLWDDSEGEFIRSYSIVRQSGKRYTFTIKLSEKGRGAKLLRNLQVGSLLKIRGVFGNFLLQDTPSPKVFIATGTGLAPIYNMILSLPADVKKTLYFTVGTKDELFYREKLREIKNLNLHVHTTKEEVEGCTFGRVDVDNIEAPPDTEWYLCGNPRMVSEAKEKLMKRGYEKVYSEEFI